MIWCWKKKLQMGDASFFIFERHLASDDTEYTSCSVQSCLFVQCWLGIFLAQCSGNLLNVGAAFAPTGYYQKINRFKIKIPKKWCCSDDNALSFIVQWCLSLLDITQAFYLCNIVPRVLRQHWTGFFCALLSGASRTTLHREY